MSLIDIIIFSIIQGITELFPVSSLGHSVILPPLFHWNIDRNSESFLPIMVALHLGTAVALLIFYRKEWLKFLSESLKPGQFLKNKKFLYVILATIPAGLIGFLFEKKLKFLFGSEYFVAGFLILNGILMILGDRLKKRKSEEKPIEGLQPKTVVMIGLAQALALFPGISRSGITLIAGIFFGLSYAQATEFSFLLATPIILGAGLLEVPKLFHANVGIPLSYSLTGAVVSGIFAYLSTWFLTTYFKKHDFHALRPFGIYCLLIGIVSLAIFTLSHP